MQSAVSIFLYMLHQPTTYLLIEVVNSPLIESFAKDWIPFQKYVLGMLGISKAVFAVEIKSGVQCPVLRRSLEWSLLTPWF